MSTTEVKQIANFIFSHYPASWTWNEDDLAGWIVWLTVMKFLFVVWHEGKVVGLCACRPLSLTDIADAAQFDARFNEQSPFLYSDFILGDHPTVLRGIAEALVNRYGRRARLFYRRQGGPVRSRDFASLMNHMARYQLL